MSSIKKTKSLLFRFTRMFLLFIVAILLVLGLTIYFTQLNIYKRQCELNIRNIGEYLASIMQDTDIESYQEYYMNHYEEMEIPYNFTEYESAYQKFEELFEEAYPGQILGKDIEISDTSDEVQKAYYEYLHEYWILLFEKARSSFSIPYSYYLVIDDPRARDTGYPDHNVVYMIDGERTAQEEQPDLMFLGDAYHYDPEKYEIMWTTWETKKAQEGYMEWDNEWGHTYGYYTPLTVNGVTFGLVVTEIDFATVNHNILINTLQTLLAIGIILVAGMLLMLMIINRIFVLRTRRLENDVRIYSNEKNASIATEIIADFHGEDEIDSLGQQFANMILNLEEHIKNLTRTEKDLEDTKQRADEMDELSKKDSLTGIRNKTAYDKEVQKVEWELESGETAFGVAMVDLNFLKRINDTYGHDKGNIAIKRLCDLVCKIFQHSPVFRIGGDEFAVILKDHDYEHIDELTDQFRKAIQRTSDNTSLEYWERTSAALGVALFDPSLDNCYDSVFRRADTAMYAQKRAMKAVREI